MWYSRNDFFVMYNKEPVKALFISWTARKKTRWSPPSFFKGTCYTYMECVMLRPRCPSVCQVVYPLASSCPLCNIWTAGDISKKWRTYSMLRTTHFSVNVTLRGQMPYVIFCDYSVTHESVEGYILGIYCSALLCIFILFFCGLLMEILNFFVKESIYLLTSDITFKGVEKFLKKQYSPLNMPFPFLRASPVAYYLTSFHLTSHTTNRSVLT